MKKKDRVENLILAERKNLKKKKNRYKIKIELEIRGSKSKK